MQKSIQQRVQEAVEIRKQLTEMEIFQNKDFNTIYSKASGDFVRHGQSTTLQFPVPEEAVKVCVVLSSRLTGKSGVLLEPISGSLEQTEKDCHNKEKETWVLV